MSETDTALSSVTQDAPRPELKSVKRVVVKIGSALLTGGGTALDRAKIQSYGSQIHALMQAGYEVVLVSSGAVAEGCLRLGWQRRPETVHELQAAAAVGQMGLTQAYEEALSAHQRRTAMIMLTHEDLADRQRYLNAKGTLTQLLQLGVVPVINENDTVATDEIRFGDNDTLAALVTNLLAADLLIILTDVNGLMSADPRLDPNAQIVARGAANDTGLDALVGDTVGQLGRGGMVTKLRAARLAARSGAHTIIAPGAQDGVLTDVLEGHSIGTLLVAEVSPMTARKRWIAGQLRAKGDLIVDAGAARALRAAGVSLLAVGLTAVRGEFLRGDVVRCIDPDGTVVAQGLVNYSSSDATRLIGIQSEAFAEHLDYVGEPELIHRDNLVVL